MKVAAGENVNSQKAGGDEWCPLGQRKERPRRIKTRRHSGDA